MRAAGIVFLAGVAAATAAARASAQPAAPSRDASTPTPSAPSSQDNPPPPTVTQEVRVSGARPAEGVTRMSIDRRELESMPGTGGDALRTVESMPGVARAPAFSGLVIVRGSAPEDTQIFVDGTAVPVAFHFGGLSAIIPTDLLERLDFYPGNYDVFYGRGLGGVIELGLRSPARDRAHAAAKVDLLDGRALVETPLDAETRVLVAARRSWMDAWFPRVASALQVGVVASPIYDDWQLVAERDLGARAKIRATFFGADDGAAVTLPPDASDPAFTGLLHDSSTFWRAQLRADGKSAGGARWTALAAFGHDTLALGLQNYRAEEDVWRQSARADVDAEIARGVRGRAGIDVEAGWYDFDLIFPPVPTPDEPDIGPIFGRPPLHQTRHDTYVDPAAYGTITATLGDRWRVGGGVRADKFSGVPGVAVQPRASARWLAATGERPTAIKAALGLYAQEPQPYENDPVFGTPGIAYERALHASIGLEQTFAYGVTLSLEPFYKDLFDLVSRRPDPSTPSGFRYGNEGIGFVYGTELLLRYKPDERFLGWIAYTISRSERRALPEQDFRIFEYDQTHVLSALGSVRVGDGWELGARFRYVTGDPYTPIVGGAFDADAGAYAPIEQRPLYAARVPPFLSLDVRIEKVWRLSERARVAAYVDVLNAFNRRNVEALTSNFDFTRSSTIAGVPFLPVLGVKGEL